MTEPLFIAKAKEPLYLLPKMANRHGLIAGATGTGKTAPTAAPQNESSAGGLLHRQHNRPATDPQRAGFPARSRH